MGAGGRPRKPIDIEELKRLCAIQCTAAEMASVLDCSVDHIENVIKDKYGIGFSEFFAQHRGTGQVSLRRRQYMTAMDGNVQMLIWLGKNWLKQTDKQEVTHTGDVGVVKVRVVDEDAEHD